MPAPVPCQERNPATGKGTKDVRIGRIAKRSLLPQFTKVSEARHRVKPAAANDADFRLRQESP